MISYKLYYGFKMNIKYFFFLFSILFSLQANALSSPQKIIAVGITQQTFARVVMPAVLNGVGKREAINLSIKLAKSSAGRRWIIDELSPYIIAERNSVMAQNAADIIIGASINDASFQRTINKEMVNFDAHVVTLTMIANMLDKEKDYHCLNDQDIYKKDFDHNLYLSSYHSPIEEWDFGSYYQMKSNALLKDKLDHDHIPSIGAVLVYLKNRDNVGSMDRYVAPGSYVNKNATAIEVKHDFHRKGRTYKSKNKVLIQLDALNLRLATIKDFAFYYILSKTLSKEVIYNFSNVYARNSMLCLYK